MEITVIAGFLLTLIAASALWRTACSLVAWSWISQAPSDTGDATVPPLVILLPALREQALVVETLAHFSDLDYPSERYRILVVTSERERLEHHELGKSLGSYVDQLWSLGPGKAQGRLTGHLTGTAVAGLLAQRPSLSREAFYSAVADAYQRARTTAESVDEVAAMTPLVRRIEAPREWRLKAGQIRYATAHLDDALRDWPLLPACRYVAIYDFDARPARDALQAAAVAARSGAPILQQPGFTVPRRPAGAPHLGGMFSLLDGQMHARWALRAELWNVLFDRLLDRLPRPIRAVVRSSIHTVGNGLFLDRLQLAALGGIPPVVDDLALGWRAAGAGVPVVPVRSPVFYDAYVSLTQAARSRAFIGSGYLRAIQDIRSAPHRVPGTLPVHLLRVYLRLLQPACGPYLRLLVFAGTAWVLPTWTAAVILLTHVLYAADISMVHALWRRFRLVHSPARTRVVALVLGPVALLWYGSGFRMALISKLLRRRTADPGKTER